MKELKFLSNIDISQDLKTLNSNIRFHYYDGINKKFSSRFMRFFSILKFASKIFEYDYIMFYYARTYGLLSCIIKLLFRLKKPYIISVDWIESKPTKIIERYKARLKKVIYKKVDLFLLQIKDISGYSKYYDISCECCRYVPYKVNSLRRLLTEYPSDKNYILSCGRSRRDYNCLIKAVSDIPFKTIILCNVKELRRHGSHFDYSHLNIPNNVELICDDGSKKSWIKFLKDCTMLVLPISNTAIYAEGTGTYLEAMALKKPVIISNFIGIRGILDENCACFVSQNNPEHLKESISKLLKDKGYRENIATNGYNYAMSLGGTSQLKSNIVKELNSFIKCY